MFFSSHTLQKTLQSMNTLGKNGVPFLFLLDFELEKPLVLPLDELDSKEILYKFSDIKNYGIHPDPHPVPLVFEKFPMSFPAYEAAFQQVKKELLYGNSFLTNLTFPTKIKTNYSLLQLFNKSRARYKLYYKNRFIVFSPEIFVKIRNGKISSFPMKGTIDAALPNALEKLMADTKEIAEHYTIVDLIRNDLGIVSEKVEVKRFRYVERIRTVDKSLYQTSSEIEGTLPDGYTDHLGDIILSLLPAGSISGAPKKKTVEIIQAAEGQKRGYYTGIMGLFDGQHLDSAVMIRYIEKNGDDLFFRSGCGITAQSDGLSEYREMIDKVYVPLG